VTFFDSSGLNVLIELVELAGGVGGHVALHHTSREVRQLLDITGLDSLVAVAL